MYESSKTRRLLIGAVLLCAVVLLLYGFFLREIFMANRALHDLEGNLSVQTGREEYLRSIRNVLLDTELERSRISSYFVVEGGVVSFIERIERLARVVGVDLDIQSVSISSAEKTVAFHEWLELSVEVEGSWQELYRMLALIENMPVALSLSDVRLRYTEQEIDGETIGLWRGSFNLRVAKQKE